jgi:hypothetical protein
MLPKQWRSQTVPNHKDKHRDIVEGWDRWLPRIVAIVALVGSLWKASGWCSDVISVQKEIKADVAAVKDGLHDKISTALAEHDLASEYVTRREWLTDKQAQDAAVGSINSKIDTLIDRQYRTNHLLESVHPTKETPR